MRKVLTATAVTIISGMLISAAPASAGNFNAIYGTGNYGTNAQLVEVKAQPDKFGSNAFKRHFDGSPRVQKRQLNRRHQGNRQGFGRRHGWENLCVKPRRIHRRLVRQGWSDFHDLRIRRRNIRVKAYRNNGLLYSIKIHRCTGHIVSTQLDWSSLQNSANYFDNWNYFKRSARR